MFVIQFVKPRSKVLVTEIVYYGRLPVFRRYAKDIAKAFTSVTLRMPLIEQKA